MTSLLPAGDEAEPTIPFTDLSIQWRQIEEKALPDICRLFENSAFCLGPFVERFEEAAAKYLGIAHAIGVNSGTSALHLALIAAGVGPGDKVLVPSYLYRDCMGVLYVGATPVLCDIEEESATTAHCRCSKGDHSGPSLWTVTWRASWHLLRGTGWL